MNLPNGHRSRIDPRKLLEYSLSNEHDEGKHKARLFRDLLGIDVDSAELLIDALRAAAADGEATFGRSDRYGQRYRIDFEFKGPAGKAVIRSAWIVRVGETLPELVTCYIM